jgi:hypothetical protein
VSVYSVLSAHRQATQRAALLLPTWGAKGLWTWDVSEYRPALKSAMRTLHAYCHPPQPSVAQNPCSAGGDVLDPHDGIDELRLGPERADDSEAQPWVARHHDVVPASYTQSRSGRKGGDTAHDDAFLGEVRGNG